VVIVSPNLKNVQSRQAFCLIAGPVASLLMGSIFIIVTFLTPGHAWQQYWMLLAMLATFSISAFVVNLMPIRPESQYSDGAQLYQVLGKGPWARVHLAFAMLNIGLVSPRRPRDLDVNVINGAADAVPHGERGLLLRLFASIHYLDANLIPEAIARMEEAEALYEESVFERPQDICTEFLFINAFHKRDWAASEKWAGRIDDLRKVDLDVNYWRAKTALHWLRGEREQAHKSWERGNRMALKLPAAGTYDFTRSCFEKLRIELDGPPRKSLLTLASVRNDPSPSTFDVSNFGDLAAEV
jgi:hypothetical protein